MLVVVVATEQGGEREGACAGAFFPASPRTMMSNKKTSLLSVFSTLQHSSQSMSGSMISRRKTRKPTPRSHVDSHTPADLH